MTPQFKSYLSDLYWYNFGLGFVNKILGIDFFRCFEYSIGVAEIPLPTTMKVLDIGETKFGFFPLYLAEKKRVEVTVLDIDKRIKTLINVAERRDLKLNAVVSGAESMPFPDSTFDVIYCISTIEHIPNDGDIKTMREINRVLKSDGKAYITTSFGNKYNEGKWGRWFFRVYDYTAMENRLIKSSGLKFEKVIFHGDSNMRKFSDMLYKLPKPVRLSLGWSHIFFAKYFYGKDKADKNDAGLVIIVLSKSN